MKLQFIYWKTEQAKKGSLTACEVHITVGYNPASLADYNEMAAELRKAFPQANDNEIQCGITHQTTTMAGHTIIVWTGYLPRGEYPEWRQVVDKEPEYAWRTPDR